jgi:hypothetical protein
VVALCAEQATTQADGTTGPLICPDGGLNALAWVLLVPVSPRVLSAGPAVTLKNLQIALCADVNLSHAKVPQEISAYELAAAYYGWNFAADPTVNLATAGCPR